MTSIILGQKIMSVKLCKGEFEKVKLLRDNNLENSYKLIPSLKKAIDSQLRYKTCRLCLKPGQSRIFGDQEFDYMSAMKHILQIKVKENDGKPQHICTDCATTLRNAAQLKQTAEVSQWRLQQELEMVTSTLLDQDVKGDSTFHGGYFVEQGPTIAREWTCGKCRRIFESQETFSEHEKLPRCRDTGNKCFVCETCGVELKSLTRLKRHRLIHTGELHFSCSQCPYRGRTKYAVMVHERAHTGVRPLVCPHCPAKFLNSSNLASHKRRHLPPTYHCQVCAKSFKFKEALQNHQATQHSTAKPHICNSCGKEFSTRKMMRRHERKVHNRPKMHAGIMPTYLRQQGDPT